MTNNTSSSSSSQDPFTCTLETCSRASGFVQYDPNLAATLAYLIIFAIFFALQLGLGVWYRTWGFCFGMTSGLVLEVIGYIGRLLIRSDPFNLSIFLTYFIPLGLGPAFMTASIYLTLGRIVVVYGESYSRVKPRVYTVTFVTIDFFSLCIQAVGGALTSVARTDGARQVGVDILIAGLTLQAASLFFFLCLCAEFAWRVRRGDAKMRNPRFEGFRETRRFKLFLYAIATAAISIFIRCMYRIIELAQGFGGTIANEEIPFLILEGPMIMVAMLALTLFHPGWVFGSGLWGASTWHLRVRREVGVREGVEGGEAGSGNGNEGVDSVEGGEGRVEKLGSGEGLVG